MGDGLLYRSPTAPLYFDSDVDFTFSDVLRSSSTSACVSGSRLQPSSPSTALSSLSLLSRLPSSPVATPPQSPEIFHSYNLSEPVKFFSTTASIDVAAAPLCHLEVNSEPMIIHEKRVTLQECDGISNKKEENNNQTPPPPTAPKKNLPRCYSSSETHLNTRRRLENQSGDASEARKSFSSDQVGKNFPPAPPSPVLRSSDLARCDSWSTSGLGSEISDWDSLHGDPHDDAQGPFDAVFSDVFPGGDSVSETSSTEAIRRTKKPSKRTHRNVYFTSSLNNTKEPVASSPTPRPVSLPGVTGTYIASLNVINPYSNLEKIIINYYFVSRR